MKKKKKHNNNYKFIKKPLRSKSCLFLYLLPPSFTVFKGMRRVVGFLVLYESQVADPFLVREPVNSPPLRSTHQHSLRALHCSGMKKTIIITTWNKETVHWGWNSSQQQNRNILDYIGAWWGDTKTSTEFS